MTNQYETLKVTITPPFAHIALNRPHVKNAMNNRMILDLINVFDSLKEDRTIRAVTLSGTDGTFCAGGDLREMAQTDQNSEGDHFSASLDRMLKSINEAPQVVIARVEGAAMGGGFGIVCVCDIALASTEAKFGLPEVRLGIVPALIAPYVIERIGLSHAREIMLTGRRFDGITALKYGVVHEALAPSELDLRLQTILDEIKLCSPHALAACKELLFKVKSADTDSTITYRANMLMELRRSDNGQEGMHSFIEKRKPKWAAER